MYTYLPVASQDYYLIFQDNNPLPQAKAYSESMAQTIINALNLQEQLQYTINQVSMGDIEFRNHIKNLIQSQDIRSKAEPEEDVPPQLEEPIGEMKLKAIRRIITSYHREGRCFPIDAIRRIESILGQ